MGSTGNFTLFQDIEYSYPRDRNYFNHRGNYMSNNRFRLPEFNVHFPDFTLDNLQTLQKETQQFISEPLNKLCHELESFFLTAPANYLPEIESEIRKDKNKYSEIFSIYLVWLAMHNSVSSLNERFFDTIYNLKLKSDEIFSIGVAFQAKEFIQKCSEILHYRRETINEMILLAAAEKNLEMVRFIATVDDIARGYQPDSYVLFLAIHLGKKDIVEYLLDNGFDVNATDLAGRSCLHHAVLASENSDDAEMIAFLLQRGANTRAKYRHMTALDLANDDKYKRQAAFSLLIKEDPGSLNYKYDVDPGSLYHQPIDISDLPLEKVLVTLVNNINKANPFAEAEAVAIIGNRRTGTISQVKDVFVDIKIGAHTMYGFNYDSLYHTFYDPNTKSARECVEQLRKELLPAQTPEMLTLIDNATSLLKKYLQEKRRMTTWFNDNLILQLVSDAKCKVLFKIDFDPFIKNYKFYFYEGLHDLNIEIKEIKSGFLISLPVRELHDKLSGYFQNRETRINDLMKSYLGHQGCRIDTSKDKYELEFVLKKSDTDDTNNSISQIELNLYLAKLNDLNLSFVVKMNNRTLFPTATIIFNTTLNDIYNQLSEKVNKPTVVNTPR